MTTSPAPRRRRGALALALAGTTAVAALAAAGTAAAATVGGGTTTLKLDAATTRALGSLKVKVAPIGAAKFGAAGISFPITKGKVALDTAAGVLEHSGGLRLSAGATRLSLTSFVVKVGAASTLTAKVGGARISLLAIDTKQAKVKAAADFSGTKATGLKAKLTAKAAAALNRKFKVTAFKRGLVLGTVSVDARRSLRFTGGTTTVTYDAATVAVLTGGGVVPSTIAPGVLSPAPYVSQFPIAGGTIDAKTLKGTIKHRGGLRLTKGTVAIDLTDYQIRLGKTRTLAATTPLGTLDIADVDLSGLKKELKLTATGGTVKLSGISSKLQGTAGVALNAVFGVSVPLGGGLGVVAVEGTVE